MAGKAGRRGWGWVRKLPSGRWGASYIWPPELDRHYAPMTFGERIDAEGWLAGQRRLIEQDRWEPPAKALARKWLQSRAISQAPRIIDTLELPDTVAPHNYLYVIELVGMGTKVGITTTPRKRLRTLQREARGYGYRIGRIWLSQAHIQARANERELIRLGGDDNRREYLAVDFVRVIERAEALTRTTGQPLCVPTT
ncbi:MAG: hypothetical protein QOH54_1268 [Mycobacterium sp.]|nr:hypothetical protein [Mycobacterium sp.]